jgi:hypothetical protein
MIYGIRTVVRYLLGTDIAGRTLAIYPDDTFVVSYPRSGNTWTRFLIANLLHPEEPVTFATIERIVPDSEAQSRRTLRSIPRPRVIKSHQYFHPRFRKVIYIVRDPRDVVLSYYDFQRKYRQIQDGYPLSQYVREFLEGGLGLGDWGTWAENVQSWISTREGHPGFLLLRYEDMSANTGQELAKLAWFLGINPNPQLLANAIERSSADRLRELERVQAKEWVSTKNRRDDIPFIRTATSGGWKENLPADAVASIEGAWGSLMRHLGYPLTMGEPSQPGPQAADLQPSFRGETSG